MKKINLLYFSPTETTEKVVSAIGQAIGTIHHTYNITLPQSRKEIIEFGPDDIVIIGAPVYSGRVVSVAMDYFKKVKGNGTLGIFISVYGNRAYEDALLELKETLESQGFKGLAAGAFIGEHSYTDKVAGGRPDAQDLNLAKAFGTKISELLKWEANQTNSYELNVKGNHPYKPGMASAPPAGPKTEDTCTECGICAEFCPTGSIDFERFRYIEGSNCIKCCSCVKKCPENAKYFDIPQVLDFKDMLEKNLSNVRNEPEMFLP